MTVEVQNRQLPIAANMGGVWDREEPILRLLDGDGKTGVGGASSPMLFSSICSNMVLYFPLTHKTTLPTTQLKALNSHYLHPAALSLW